MTPARLLPIVCLLLVSSGCAGYRVGNNTLFPPDIRTVYVPMFDSNSYYRGLEQRLTEAVVKEIELRTPYKVVSSPDADSVLTGRIVDFNKGVLIPDPMSLPRDYQLNMKIEVSWLDRQGQLVRQSQPIPIPSAVLMDSTSDFVPEVGQSLVTQQQEVIDRLAQQIVSLMETPW